MTPCDTAIVLQARYGSTRLPGKALAPLGSRTLLEHCIVRLQVSGLPVILATTSKREDDALAREAERLGAGVFRGNERDVLSRYIDAALCFGLRTIIRATGDNPVVDMGAATRVLDRARQSTADHVVEHGLPVGAAVEAVSVAALVRSEALITDAYDREHVTSFVRRDSRFNALRVMAPESLVRPNLRLTVDTAADLAFVRVLYAGLRKADEVPELGVVISAAERQLTRQINVEQARRGA